MSARRDLRAIRRAFRFDTAEEATEFVAAMARRSSPGMAVAIALDRHRRLVDFRPVDDGAEHLPDVLRFLVVCGDRRTESVLLLTDRTGEPLADHPDDELLWEELVGLADALGVRLVDWWVMFGTKAFSVAEFAPTPAAW
jgi:hypothetical protein